MSKLVINALRCVETTSGAGNDQVYMVVFRGSFTSPPDVKVVGGKNSPWGDMGDGKLVVKDVELDNNSDPGNVYVVILVEQDVNIDFKVDGAGAKVIELWANLWMKGSGDAFHQWAALMSLLAGGGLDNDDLIGARAVPKIFKVGGTGVLLEFNGDGGYYRARAVKRS